MLYARDRVPLEQERRHVERVDHVRGPSSIRIVSPTGSTIVGCSVCRPPTTVNPSPGIVEPPLPLESVTFTITAGSDVDGSTLPLVER